LDYYYYFYEDDPRHAGAFVGGMLFLMAVGMLVWGLVFAVLMPWVLVGVGIANLITRAEQLGVVRLLSSLHIGGAAAVMILFLAAAIFLVMLPMVVGVNGDQRAAWHKPLARAARLIASIAMLGGVAMLASIIFASHPNLSAGIVGGDEPLAALTVIFGIWDAWAVVSLLAVVLVLVISYGRFRLGRLLLFVTLLILTLFLSLVGGLVIATYIVGQAEIKTQIGVVLAAPWIGLLSFFTLYAFRGRIKMRRGR
jgi:hypothetical protein